MDERGAAPCIWARRCVCTPFLRAAQRANEARASHRCAALGEIRPQTAACGLRRRGSPPLARPVRVSPLTSFVALVLSMRSVSLILSLSSFLGLPEQMRTQRSMGDERFVCGSSRPLAPLCPLRCALLLCASLTWRLHGDESVRVCCLLRQTGVRVDAAAARRHRGGMRTTRQKEKKEAKGGTKALGTK